MKHKEKFIPYEKLSKRRKREIDRKKRGSWNGVNPVTRTAESKKVYHRKRIPMPDDGRDPFSLKHYKFSQSSKLKTQNSKLKTPNS